MKKIAIITGATGGLGKEFVKIMNGKTDEIWAVARNKKKLEALRKEYGEKIVSISLDLSEIDSLKVIKDRLKKEEVTVKYLINNAGAAKLKRSDKFTTEELDMIVNLNCKASPILTNICMPYMKEGSRILFISSASAFQPVPYINLYAATKAFMRSYSRALNSELKNTGITCTAVCPGWIDTDMIKGEINGKPVKFPGLVKPDRVAVQAIKDADKGRDMSVCTMYAKFLHMNGKTMSQKMSMKIWMKGIRKYGFE